MPINPKSLYRLFLAIPVMGAMALSVFVSLDLRSAHARTGKLQSGEIDATQHALILSEKSSIGHVREWTETVTVLSGKNSENDAVAIDLLERALNEAPSNPNAWALLSFLRTRDANAFTEKAELALQQSMHRCGYCGRDLLKWRLTFVLQHWTATSEETRTSAFSGADFLRWWYLEYDFLNDVRANAISRGIPFDEYRRRVDSPVRPNEVQ